ncbi:MAG: hypothetical protein K5739_04035 [Lachnospiraceae bacterium]|nr:hypothetical protein [Lachnospiraceae bacterium]
MSFFAIQKGSDTHKKNAGLRKAAYFSGVLLSFFLSGCGMQSGRDLVPPADHSYLATERDTVTVEKGTVSVAYEHPISLSGYREQEYRIPEGKLAEMESAYDIKLGSVNITLGDHVKTGDVLVSFQSDELDKKLRESRQNKKLALLKLEHIENLSRIDPVADHTEQIRLLQNECKVADLYISDIQSVYSSFNIVAESEGLISEINPALESGFIPAGKILFKVIDDDGYYIMKAAPGEDPLPAFTPGEHYTAKGHLMDYEVEVIAPPQGQEEDKDAVFFRPVTEKQEFHEENLVLVGKEEKRDNVCHVLREAVIEKEDGQYVYVKREDGQFQGVKVKPGIRIGDDVEILEGLSGGEQVALP